jgi:hypothetical protein
MNQQTFQINYETKQRQFDDDYEQVIQKTNQ